ncbi:SDR family NAD(P)-dependent oxidoreductase [Mycobacterium talmoniae]|uniref:3-oxoacyl-[acyl-carrier-protein] reductase FabG n=1 Tax=Mycobacterium talmoniae TaxID=1858794 RepID=A0A1S1NM03_9MYCO|nr:MULTISPECIES: SDR family NAD(P)-dependent oxidoreductase [Mycobacterium]OHV04984.1 hypothetical protein BKN37_07625 [Mycobacterium talmoniae]PQM48352.1 3-oxoacyl-[acyl-carrier-protein] reductase FabG [Mycobacterium talmoniae]
MTANAPVVLVTGGNRGLGFATVRALNAAGARVIIGARERKSGLDAVARLADDGLVAESVVIDVSSDVSVAEAAAEIGRTHGSLDILVNNAGVLLDPVDDTVEAMLDPDVLRETLEINTVGPARVTRYLLSLLGAGARIFNLSSATASFATLDHSSVAADEVMLAYRMSKSALNTFTVLLSKLLADRQIAVNAINPGWSRTDMNPRSRVLAPLSPEQAGRHVAALILAAEVPTGQWLSAHGMTPW